MTAEQWLDLVETRAHRLRRAGILSVEVAGFSAVFAPADPEPDGKTQDQSTGDDATAEPADAWVNGASYPTGRVPSFGEVDPADKLPEIPSFEDA